MRHHNHYYGQAHLLARHSGLDDVNPPPIRGYLQHGGAARVSPEEMRMLFDWIERD